MESQKPKIAMYVKRTELCRSYLFFMFGGFVDDFLDLCDGTIV